MDLRSIYISNGTGILILCILAYSSRTKLLRRRTQDKLFAFLIIGVMLACFMEAFSYSIDGKLFPGARFLNYVANTYLFSVNLMLPFCVLVYVDLELYDDPGRLWRNYKPQVIIGLFMFTMNIINFFVPVTYVITDQNVYERRPFSYVYYFVILYYCASAMRLTHRYEKENGAKAFFSIEMFLLPILLGAGLQFCFYGLSLAWLSAALGLVGLFMMQQNELAYMDALTDTYNRQYLNHILTAWISRGNSFSGVMMDMDGFKQINDQFGHSEGDNALKTVANTLMQARMDNKWVFRYAGDEFIILKLGANETAMWNYVEDVNRMLKIFNSSGHPYKLAVSYGITRFESGDVDSFMREMDSRMYAMKAAHHESAAHAKL